MVLVNCGSPNYTFEIRTSYLLLGIFQLSQHVSDLINTSEVLYLLLYQLRKADVVRVHYSVSINSETTRTLIGMITLYFGTQMTTVN